MSDAEARSIEHREIRGITLRNTLITIFSTISIVVSIMTTYFNLKEDIKDANYKQDTQNRVNELRFKVIEDHQALIDQQIHEIKQKQ